MVQFGFAEFHCIIKLIKSAMFLYRTLLIVRGHKLQ